jgi:hypothetical protein
MSSRSSGRIKGGGTKSMKKPRRNHSVAFKARVALEAIRTLPHVSSRGYFIRGVCLPDMKTEDEHEHSHKVSDS